jgi:hypothetical protein
MQYMLLIYVDPTAGPDPQSPEGQEQSARWFTYTQGLQSAGVHRSGEGLQPPHTATTVSVRDGERVVTDGPFADTKEWLGGFYVVDAADLDAAVDHAAGMPHIESGWVEVRPIMVFDDTEDQAADATAGTGAAS